MRYQCAACGDIFSPMIGHECIAAEAGRHKNQDYTLSKEFLTLVDRLEKLSRENEQLRFRIEVLTAKIKSTFKKEEP